MMTHRCASPLGMMALIAVGLLIACGQAASNDEASAATALAEARLPTLEAQLTQFSVQLTQHPDAFNTPATVIIATPAGPDSDPDRQAEAVALLTSVALTNAPLLSGAGGQAPISGGTPGFSGGDGHDTTAVNILLPGEAKTGQITAPFDAHNWLYQGKAGQVVTIRVTGPQTDPRVSLIDPTGAVLAENDDAIRGVDVNALLVATLPVSGTYTIRVTAWNVGNYTLLLTAQ